MKQVAIFAAALSLALLFSCSGPKSSSKGHTRGDGKIEIVLVHMNDVYEIAPMDGGATAGMARVATVIKQLRAENPNTFVMHAGDFLSPSVFNNLKLDGERIKGMQMIEVMNAAGVDYVTFGNHEFDMKLPELQERIDSSGFTWFSTNVLKKSAGETSCFSQKNLCVPRTLALTASDSDGTKLTLGVFGVTLAFNMVDYVHYNDYMATALRAADSLNRVTDLVVGLTHLYRRQDSLLALEIQDVPLFMGGHDHENMNFTVGKTRITKADANAKTIYIHRISYDFADSSFTIKSELKAIDNSIPDDPETAKIVAKWQQIMKDAYAAIGVDPDEVLMNAGVPLEGRESVIRNEQTNLGAIITSAMYAASPEVDGVILNSGSVRVDDQLKGEITQYDIMRTLPFGGAVVEVDMTGFLLKQVLEAGELNAGSGGYLQLGRIHKENGTWYVEEKALDIEKIYRIAMPDFLLTGMETRLEILKEGSEGMEAVYRPESGDVREDVRLVVIQYLKRG